jgi:hypothetical protein
LVTDFCSSSVFFLQIFYYNHSVIYFLILIEFKFILFLESFLANCLKIVLLWLFLVNVQNPEILFWFISSQHRNYSIDYSLTREFYYVATILFNQKVKIKLNNIFNLRTIWIISNIKLWIWLLKNETCIIDYYFIVNNRLWSFIAVLMFNYIF